MFTHTTAAAIPPPIVSTLRLVAGFVLSCGQVYEEFEYEILKALEVSL
jgi:hypothetical protein